MKLLFSILALIIAGSVRATEHLPSTIDQNNNQYERCNAFTLRYALVIKVVEIGWYAPNCSEASTILETGNKIVRFHYLKNVDADFFKESAEEYFLLNLDDEVLQKQLTEPLLAFNAGYTDITGGEYFDLVHSGGSQLSLYKNHELLTVSDNSVFSQAYFNIWFGRKPVISKLKNAFSN